jgi:ATP-binding cassette, subfamily B, bacterial PglK
MKKNNLYLLRELWKHILPKRRKQYVALLALMVLGSFAELVSIGAVIPFLGALTAPEQVFQYSAIQPLIDVLNITSPHELLLPLTILFAAVVIIAGAVRLILLWVNARLSYATGADISIAIYRRTLYQPYETHIQRNSSEIINTISTKTNIVTSNIIYPVLSISSSILIVTAIVIALMIIDPVISMVCIVTFGLMYALVILVTKERLRSNGQIIAIKSTTLIKYLQEGLGGIRDVLLDGSQEKYCKEYRNTDLPLRRAEGSNLFFSQSPRFVIEAIGIILIATIAYYMSLEDGGIYKVMPVLGALAIGAQRMMPALQQIYFGWSNIQGGIASLEDTLLLLDQPTPTSEDVSYKPLLFKDKIVLRNLCFCYAQQSNYVLNNINLTIEKGECVGFIGATGSGKSTLLDIIMGLLEPTSGELLVDGVPISKNNVRLWQKNIAHTPQSIFLIDGSIKQNISFDSQDNSINSKKVESAAKKSQLLDFINNAEHGYDTMVGEQGIRISGGQRQRIGIARALYKDTDVLMFDEATSALDSKTEHAIITSIEKAKKNNTVFMVAHRLTTLKNCDKIIELNNGSIVNIGTYNDISTWHKNSIL